MASAATLLSILLLDGAGVLRQCLLGLATSLLLWQIISHLHVPARNVLTAIAVATAGEIALSLGWRLYSYRYALIPLYVPPGHGVFYALAAATAEQAVVRRYSAMITSSTLLVGSSVATVTLLAKHDAWGMLWWIGFLLLMRRAQNKTMLAACFLYTMLLELTGVALGNWRWVPVVPFVGLHSANPPAGVGILYAAVDLSVAVLLTSRSGVTIKP